MSETTKRLPYPANPDRLLAALRLTEAVTGFRAQLIEKDYLSSVVLRDLVGLFGRGLIFKGGTSLSKVYTEFCRLSEDLDFAVPISPDARRSARRNAAKPFITHFVDIAARLECFRVPELLGYNDLRQYSGRLAYRSVVTGEEEFLRVDISLREEVLLPTVDLPAKTLLLDPDTNAPAIAPVNVRVLSVQEAYSEKVRAALTRPVPAIRDFFDIDSAVQKAILNHLAPDFLQLVAQKLTLTDDPVDTSPTKIASLKPQLEADLKPVLRAADYETFLLELRDLHT